MCCIYIYINIHKNMYCPSHTGCQQIKSPNNTPNRQTKVRVFIEGNIGVGKSKIVNCLRMEGYECVTEPVASWNRLLDQYYADPTRFSFLLQMTIVCSLASRHAHFMSNTSSNIVVFERSIKSSQIFTRNAVNNKYMTASDHNIIEKTIKRLEDTLNTCRDIHIYLKCDPAVCCERIKVRQRCSEVQQDSCLDNTYLKALHDLHEQEFRSTMKNVYIVNANRCISDVVSDVNSIIKSAAAVNKGTSNIN